MSARPKGSGNKVTAAFREFFLSQRPHRLTLEDFASQPPASLAGRLGCTEEEAGRLQGQARDHLTRSRAASDDRPTDPGCTAPPRPAGDDPGPSGPAGGPA